MKKFSIFFFSITFSLGEIFAIGYQGNEEMIMTLRISKIGFTRIFVPNEKIIDLMVFPEGLADIELNSLGQLIIVPQKNIKETLFVSFITDKKTVQDLSILFIDKKPEVVRILSGNSLKNSEVKNDKQKKLY